MKAETRIGCSGYYYPAWKNNFYPPGTPASKWLSHYSTIFNTVELNGTFYRLPKSKDLERYAAQTPADFRFSVKASRYITHILKLKKSKQLVDEFYSLILGGLQEKLENILFQLPPSFHFSQENLDAIVENIPAWESSVIEFRHISWWNETTENTLSKMGYTFCNTDYPGLKQTFTITNKRFYARFHGVPELFKSAYTQKELREFSKKVPADCEKKFIYFNNTYYDAAYTNAQYLQKLL